jgi:hypothetical protein
LPTFTIRGVGTCSSSSSFEEGGFLFTFISTFTTGFGLLIDSFLMKVDDCINLNNIDKLVEYYIEICEKDYLIKIVEPVFVLWQYL